MLNLKNNRGSITVFVLVSCLLFIGCVVCVRMYIQSREIATDREYRQIKVNYETDTNSLDNIYNELYKEQQALDEQKRKQEELEKATP